MKGFVTGFDDQAAHRLSIGSVDGHGIAVAHPGVVLATTASHRYFTRSCRLWLPRLFFAKAVFWHGCDWQWLFCSLGTDRTRCIVNPDLSQGRCDVEK